MSQNFFKKIIVLPLETFDSSPAVAVTISSEDFELDGNKGAENDLEPKEFVANDLESKEFVVNDLESKELAENEFELNLWKDVVPSVLKDLKLLPLKLLDLNENSSVLGNFAVGFWVEVGTFFEDLYEDLEFLFNDEDFSRPPNLCVYDFLLATFDCCSFVREALFLSSTAWGTGCKLCSRFRDLLANGEILAGSFLLKNNK